MLKCHVRSERHDILEKLQDLPLQVSHKLSSNLSVDYYTSFANASTLGKKGNTISLSKGSTTVIYWGNVNCEKYVKGSTQGAFLSGSMTLTKVRKSP